LPPPDSQTADGHSLPLEALERVWAAVEASTSVNTKAAYRSDWARFTGWASGAGYAVLPADPMVVAAYLTAAAAEQTAVGEWRYSPATLTRWTSSINQFHTAAGLAAPGRSEVVRRALSGDPPAPRDATEPAGPAAAGRHPQAARCDGAVSGLA